MSTTQSIIIDPTSPDRFVIRDGPAPTALPNQALIRVKAISINRGEVRMGMNAPAGAKIGWDFAGIVDQPAADGTGPKAGTRVVGMINKGSWAQLIAAPTNAIAELPANVTFTQAAALPVAGLTALHSLYKGGFLLGKNVLVTGATGGTGDFACQLARLAGARVTATVRAASREPFIRSLGVQNIVVGEDPSDAAKSGPYSLIIDSVAGPNFGKVLAMLATGGTCVMFGATGGSEPTFNASKFYATGSATLYGMILFNELLREPAGIGLTILADLVATGKLKPRVEIEESWRKIGQIARDLMDRKFTGKAVLNVD